MIIDPVWCLFEYAIDKIGPKLTIIERDDNMPTLSELRTEMNHARKLMEVIECL